MQIQRQENQQIKLEKWFSSFQFSSVAQSCPTLCDPMNCSLPGSSVHGIFQARTLEWGATAFSRKTHYFPQVSMRAKRGLGGRTQRGEWMTADEMRREGKNDAWTRGKILLTNKSHSPLSSFGKTWVILVVVVVVVRPLRFPPMIPNNVQIWYNPVK